MYVLMRISDIIYTIICNTWISDSFVDEDVDVGHLEIESEYWNSNNFRVYHNIYFAVSYVLWSSTEDFSTEDFTRQKHSSLFEIFVKVHCDSRFENQISDLNIGGAHSNWNWHIVIDSSWVVFPNTTLEVVPVKSDS